MSYFELVNDVSESDVEYPVLPSLATELGEIYTAILEGEPMVHQLKTLRKQYPAVPQILNILSLAYVHKEDFERAYQVNQEAYQLFPDYIFARVNMVQEYLNKDELENASEIIYPALTITEVFPKRKKIHTGEFIGFQKVRALYFVKAAMPEAFLKIIQETEELLQDEILLLQFRSHIMEMIDIYDLEEFDIISDYVEKVNDHLDEQYGFNDDEFEDDEEEDFDNDFLESDGFEPNGYDEEIQTDEPPSFFFPEQIKALYEYDFDLPQSAVETLLSLPLRELTDDLCEVLNDAVRRYEYYSADDDEIIKTLFPWHAMNLLKTIKAETAVPVMLNFLKQGQELNEFYMGDLITESLWQMFYPFCPANKNELIEFLMLPKIYAFLKLPVTHAFTQFSLHNEEHKTEVSGIFGQLISFFLERKDDPDFMDPTYMDILCEEVIDGGFAELKLLVKNIFDNNLNDDWNEDYKAWEEEYNKVSKEEYSKKTILNWKELNTEMGKIFNGE